MSATHPALRRVLLIGGTSEIGLAIVRRCSRDGPVEPALLGRDRAALERALAGLVADGCGDGFVDTVDANQTATHEAAVAAAFERSGGFDVVVLAVGLLDAQQGLDADPERAVEVMAVDFVGAGSLLLASLRALRRRGAGTLVVLSSVAIERPRASNAVYGAAKAGLDSLAQALADAVAGSGVRVLVVRPGFVHTRMTAGLPAPPFATSAEAVADATVKGMAGSATTIWAPPLLRLLFLALRALPRALWRRLPL